MTNAALATVHSAVPTNGRPRRAEVWLWLGFTLLIAAGLCLLSLNRGWDVVGEGALAQSAERVLHGEVPHRDFAEIYTGLLTYLNAAAFAIGGVRLSVLRLPLLILALGWVAALFAVARRFVPPAGAALLTLLALVWSFPNSPSPMPSWYNLFLATFGLLALTRWTEDRRAQWLVLAGFLGAASFLIKLTGLFFLAGATLFLVDASRGSGDTSEHEDGSRAACIAIIVSLALFLVVLWHSIAPRGPLGLAHFFLPIALMVSGFAVREWTSPPVPAFVRIREIVGVAVPFAVGSLVAIVPFAALLSSGSGFNDAIQGALITSFRRVSQAGMQPPRLHWLLAVVPLVLLLRPRADHAASSWRMRSWIVFGLLGGLLLAATSFFFVERIVLHSVRSLAPVLGLAGGVVAALGAPRLGWEPRKRLLVVLACSVAVFHNLIQYPFAGPSYILYVAPLTLLALGGLVAAFERTPRGLQLAVAGFYVAFAVLEVLPGSASGLTLKAGGRPPPVPVPLPRAGLLVPRPDAELYGGLIPLLHDRAGAETIWAGPEAPEVYFLGGFRNHTRALYDFLDRGERDETEFLASLEREDVQLIVVNGQPGFSRPLSAALLDSLTIRFPNAESRGRFEVRWR